MQSGMQLKLSKGGDMKKLILAIFVFSLLIPVNGANVFAEEAKDFEP
jgi:hypothetical protein